MHTFPDVNGSVFDNGLEHRVLLISRIIVDVSEALMVCATKVGIEFLRVFLVDMI